jgi:hypothetical protein
MLHAASEIAGELQDAGVRAEHESLTVARIGPASDITQGTEATFWLNTARVHYFDANTGESLLERGRVTSEPEAEPQTEPARPRVTQRT